MAIELKKLRDFLKETNATPANMLPLIHTTKSTNLINIINSKKIMATSCNVFKGEDLCYMFVGRPSYKYSINGQSDYWMMPTVFVVRFQSPPKIKRVYPFDSGAFTAKLLPDYITTFSRSDFEIDPEFNSIKTLVSVFFKDAKRYWQREPSSSADFKERYNLTALHMQIEALNKLYNEPTSKLVDDRAAAIEVQFSDDITISSADTLGIIVPEEFLRESTISDALHEITPNIETYGINPVSLDMYYGQIYDCVRSVYKNFGILR